MSEIAKKKRIPGKSDVPAFKGHDKATAGKQSQPVNDRSRDSEEIERAVYDGMRDLRANKPR
jgi:hypothetical protein